MQRRYAGSRHRLVGAEGIVGIHLHAEALRNTRHIATHIAEGVDTQFLTLQLAAAGAVVEVTHGIYHHAQCQLGYGVGVLPGGVHRYHAVAARGCQIDVVVPCARAHYYLQLLRSVQHLCIHHIGADDECVSVCHSVQQLLLLGIFLQQNEAVTCLLHYLANAIYSHFRKGFLGCY